MVQEDNPTLLQVEALRVRFPIGKTLVHAVNEVSLRVQSGEAVALVGESGSGKSTIMAAILQLLAKDTQISGRALFRGQDLLSMADAMIQRVRGREIAMIFQTPDSYLNPTKVIESQIIEPLLIHHLATPKEARLRAIELLSQVGFPDPEERLHNYPFELSGGQLQRVMIAMALMTGPKLLIADEPTTALDVTVQAEVLVLLKEIQREHGMSLILTTHDLAVAAQMADHIYVLYGGKVMEHLSSSNLTTDCRHPYLQGLLQSIPRIDGPRQDLSFIPGHSVSTVGGPPTGCLFAERCNRRFDRCRERPDLVRITADHEAACWLAEREAVK